MTDHQDSKPVEDPKPAPPPGADFDIKIEWPGAQAGITRAARGGDALTKMQEKSRQAIDAAMGTMRAMAGRVAQTMNALEQGVRPNEAEVSFGITLDAEAGAFLAKASAGAQITVKLKWNIDEPQQATVTVDE